MGTPIKASSLWVFWVLGEREARGRRHDYAARISHCLTKRGHSLLSGSESWCKPQIQGQPSSRPLAYASESKSTAISTLANDSGGNYGKTKECRKYANKSAKTMPNMMPNMMQKYAEYENKYAEDAQIMQELCKQIFKNMQKTSENMLKIC